MELIPPGAEILIPAAEIERRVAEIAGEITASYEDRSLVVIPLLKGGFMFAADLVRRLRIGSGVTLEFVGASSYGEETSSSGEVRLTLDTSTPLAGRDVLLVEDIIDTGLTLAYIQKLVLSRVPASLRTAVLLDKKARRRVDVEVSWVGFEIPDRFVFGYGLDGPGGLYRNLGDIFALAPEDRR
ncbi:hypoxanthine phosphoribosyltransferase [Candidatus Fermentibacteria bacterium]|nr:hypoxanthine phosphoribosyltransferase [Candidatus Fermentibacteria bacterium]